MSQVHCSDCELSFVWEECCCNALVIRISKTPRHCPPKSLLALEERGDTAACAQITLSSAGSGTSRTYDCHTFPPGSSYLSSRGCFKDAICPVGSTRTKRVIQNPFVVKLLYFCKSLIQQIIDILGTLFTSRQQCHFFFAFLQTSEGEQAPS